MTYSVDLLKQAKHLAKKERLRPKQASLRRAVSDAYYALFHFLTDQAARQFVGHAQQKVTHRRFLSRAFSHQAMAIASRSFAGGTLPAIHPVTVIPRELMAIADTFVTLQEERHSADYDLSATFLRTDVIALIDRVELAFKQWGQIRDTLAAELYLMDMLVAGDVRRR